jgi:hypothetical protein
VKNLKFDPSPLSTEAENGNALTTCQVWDNVFFCTSIGSSVRVSENEKIMWSSWSRCAAMRMDGARREYTAHFLKYWKFRVDFDISQKMYGDFQKVLISDPNALSAEAQS